MPPKALRGAACRKASISDTLAAFHIAFANLSVGVAQFDGHGRMTLFNRRFVEVMGVPPEAIRIGMSLDALVTVAFRHGSNPGLSLEQVLAERHAVWRERREDPFHILAGGGRTVEVRPRFTEDGGWVATCTDVTASLAALAELSAREHELEGANARLDMALGHMTQGLCAYDRDNRLVLANDRYFEIMGMPRGRIRPGVSFREVIETSVAVGNHPGLDIDAFHARRLAVLRARGVGRDEMVLGDGRVIAIAQRVLDGGGWVATYDDITEIRRGEAALRRTNLQFAAALANMRQGLIMFGPDHRVSVVNARYSELLGLAPGTVQPGFSLRDIITRTVAAGLYPGRGVDEVLAERMAQALAPRLSRYLHTLPGGRMLSVAHEPLAGGGWIASFEDITDQHRAEERIRFMARHDGLTSLPNRVLFNERLDHGLTVAGRGGRLAVLSLDIDRFKGVNDVLGHAAGDALLRAAADRLSACVREGDTVARLGGDEFAIIQAAITRPEDAGLLAERILTVFAAPFDLDGEAVSVGIRVGIALAPDDGATPGALLKNADTALHRAKAEDRSAWCFFEPGMDARLQARRLLELDLRRALAQHEFELYYQPLVELGRGAVVGFEALIRWHHPTRGMVAPSEFIPIAEEIGMIVPIGEWVLRAATAAAATWPGGLKVAVNLSPIQFRSRNLVSAVAEALAEAGLPGWRLELEITETVMLQNNDTTLAILHQLRAMGVRIAMDDFGTGYSSLSSLRSFPFDKIKIDQSFIRDLARTEGAIAIIRAVAGLGISLGMATLAEGVETTEQLARLRVEGCTEVQGYLFSRPRPVAEVADMIDRIEGMLAAG